MVTAGRGSIARLLQELSADAAAAQEWLRDFFGDPSLELLRASHDGPLNAPGGESGRVATAISYGDRSLGLIVHDAALAAESVGEVAAVVGLVYEKDRVNEELRRQRDLLSDIGDGTPALLCVIFGDGTIPPEGMNRAARELIGETHEGLSGRCFWDAVVVPEDRRDVAERIGRIVAGGAEPEHIARWGTPAGEALVAWTAAALPVVGPRPVFLVSGVDVTERERRAQELRESRSRLVAAGDDERRRLERNLHDGAQQRLVTVSLALRVAETAVAADPEKAAGMLRDASEQLTEAIAELRELARGLHPAILTDRGLGPALQALASRAPVPVTTANSVDGRLPAAVETAVYYVVSEALTNAAKHARATQISVALAVVDDRVEVTIVDDGVGGAALERGTGLRGLADRMEAIAGHLTVVSGERGTTISAQAPVAPDQAEDSRR